MRVVYKYSISPGHCSLTMPAGAEVLRAGYQEENHGVYLWAAVDTHSEAETRRFILCPTGAPIGGEKDLRYIDTIFIDRERMVLHLFEVIQVEDL